MKIEENGEKACIYTPYNPDFVREIKKIGGARWNGSAWEIPSSRINIAREILRRVYGEDDVSDVEKVDIKLTFEEEVKTSEMGGVTLYGKCIAVAYSRDGGAKVGDDVDVKVTFPEEYQAKELAGKEAIFKCAVKKIEAKELPELDDDFAKDVSEFDTLAEYKEHVKTNLVEKKENEAKHAKEDAAVDKIIENAQMDIPEAMLETQCRQMLDDFSRRMQSQGLSMDQYFQFTGMTADKMMEDMKPQALKRIQTRLVLEKVAEVENIQPTEEEVNEEISKMAEAYKMEADKLKELLGERELEQMKKDMAVQKAVTVIADAAKEV